MKLTEDEMRQCWKEARGSKYPSGCPHANKLYVACFMSVPVVEDFQDLWRMLSEPFVEWTREMNERWGDD